MMSTVMQLPCRRAAGLWHFTPLWEEPCQLRIHQSNLSRMGDYFSTTDSYRVWKDLCSSKEACFQKTEHYLPSWTYHLKWQLRWTNLSFASTKLLALNSIVGTGKVEGLCIVCLWLQKVVMYSKIIERSYLIIYNILF